MRLVGDDDVGGRQELDEVGLGAAVPLADDPLDVLDAERPQERPLAALAVGLEQLDLAARLLDEVAQGDLGTLVSGPEAPAMLAT
jgi:hypothetical protein